MNLAKKIFLLSISTLFSVIMPARVFAQESRAVRVSTIPRDQVITQDFLLKGGEVVEVSGTVNGDLIVAGGEVLVEGVVNGDLIAAGGKVRLTGEVTQNVRAVGGELSINGKVGRNIIVAGGDIDISAADLGGGVIILGGDVRISSPIKGDLLVYAGSLVLENNIEGNVEAAVGTLTIASDTEITGDLTYTSEEEAIIANDASISGQVVRRPSADNFASKNLTDVRKLSEKAKGFQFGAKVVSFFAALFIGLLIVKFSPNFTLKCATTVKAKFTKSFIVGFLALLLTPFALIVFMLTIIGIPFAILLLFAYITLIYVSKIFVSYLLGMLLLREKEVHSKYLPLIFGLVIYYVVSFIPILGFFVGLISTSVGIGAILLSKKEVYEKAVANKII
ncbi:hypothetical protein A2714_00400 [Candidatus Woesebacteria bacterium RIFCSPHIGHO2_01_FULL_38_9]|uniref:DUF8173 domain-containing protein n=2 Tax=Candidatus Woeseibacteriota TaxID=1752722 RepID=A0A1F7Y1R4_9BACT|nr:MAG: hypothetical protein A2714_00400 [Candidatus Woesebacteria bacterium RIFCSPHIGHO2_01_FULL_38_9]OGM58297.1 MAG: hypothetical protein A3A75_04665 [Candidatus Woesebacteria bacterium RIFCSPLOWO2_01_FULL_39_10]